MIHYIEIGVSNIQVCLIEVIKDGGGNRYKIPHIDKDQLEPLGKLPKSHSCDRQLCDNVMEFLGLHVSTFHTLVLWPAIII
jgi:hypothetical protein